MNNAIVVLYTGSKPTQAVINAIGNAIAEVAVIGDVENIEIKHFDEISIAKAIMSRSCEDKMVFATHLGENPLEQACILIRERFGEVLPKNGDGGTEFMLSFHRALSVALNSIRAGAARETDKALVNAAELIANNLENIPNAMISRTGVRKFALKIVTAIYKKLV